MPTNIKIKTHVVKQLPTERPLEKGAVYKVEQPNGDLLTYTIDSSGNPVLERGITNDQNDRLERLSSDQISKVESITTGDITKLKEDYTKAEIDTKISDLVDLSNSSKVNLGNSTVLPVPPQSEGVTIPNAWVELAQNVTYTQAGGSPITGIDGHRSIAEWNDTTNTWSLVDMGELPVVMPTGVINNIDNNAVSGKTVFRATNKYPYSDDYPFSDNAIGKGAHEFLIDAFLDITYEEGFDYAFTSAYKTTKITRLFKHDSSVVPATPESLTLIGEFELDYELGRYSVMRPTTGSSNLGNSVIIVDWNAVVDDMYSNYYAYDGVGISPICFFNSLLNKRLKNSTEASILNLNGKFDSVFTYGLTDIKEWSGGSYSNANANSTFSGWGWKIGYYQNFQYAEVMVINRDVYPITSVRIAIREESHTGAILADKTVRVNIPVGGSQIVGVYFDAPIANADAKLLHLMYFANGLVTRRKWNGDYPYTDTLGFSKDTYAVLGNMVSQTTVTSSDPGFASYYRLSSSDRNWILTDEQVEDISQRVTITPEEVEVILPDKITAIVGDTLQLFYRGMIKAVNPYNYDILVSCSKGNQYPRYFEYTPVIADVGETTFRVQVKDKDGIILGSKTCQLVTRRAVNQPSTNKVFLCVGDSLTAAGTWCQEASRRLTETGGTPTGLGFSNISFEGRKSNNNIGWEGNGGWQWASYATAGVSAFRFDVSGVITVPALDAKYTNNGQTFTVAEVNITSGSGYIRCLSTGSPTASGVLTKTSGGGDATINFSASTADAGNPFWNNGALDFPNYVNTYMGGQVDCIFFLLTWNGQTPHRTDFSAIINTAKILVDHIHTNYPDCKMKIMGVQIPSLNGGMGYSYGATGTSYADGYGMVVTALNMNKAYQDWCNDPDYSSFLEFVNVSTQFDSENNMPESDRKVNTRSEKTEKRGTNGVHPNNDGYMQIADVCFRNIVANYCQ